MKICEAVFEILRTEDFCEFFIKKIDNFEPRGNFFPPFQETLFPSPYLTHGDINNFHFRQHISVSETNQLSNILTHPVLWTTTEVITTNRVRVNNVLNSRDIN